MIRVLLICVAVLGIDHLSLPVRLILDRSWPGGQGMPSAVFFHWGTGVLIVALVVGMVTLVIAVLTFVRVYRG